MSLLQMSFSGAVLILAVTLIRMAAINRLPKKTFLVLWGIVLIRLLLPFSIPSVYSAYSLISENPPASAFAVIPAKNAIPAPQTEQFESPSDPEPTAFFETPTRTFKALPAIWCIGTIFCALFFIVSYLRCRLEFSASLPVREPYAVQWLTEHPLKRRISIRQSDRISAPLTYGIFRPVILMPKKTDWTDTAQLPYILLHEYVHIRRLDAAMKLLAVSAICIHWFNPSVWIMYILFNRDLELACDESVIRQLGAASKSAYANVLIDMEAQKSGLMPLCNNFSKNAIEERIRSIMKVKKASLFAVIFSVFLILGVTAAFATSAAPKEDRTEYADDMEYMQYDGLLALRFDDYEDMYVSEFQNRVWSLTDTPEYMNLLEQSAKDESFYNLRDTNETAYFLFYILEPLTAEKWQTRTFDGYTISDFPYPDENAILEYNMSLTILDADTLTVGGYDTARREMTEDIHKILQQRTEEELRSDACMEELISDELNALSEKHSKPDRLQISTEYSFLPLSADHIDSVPEQEPIEASADIRYPKPDDSKEEPRFNANGTEEDYRSLLSLKTENYQDMSVASFDRALLDWGNEHYDSYERIEEDVIKNDFQIDLSGEERSFVTITQHLSGNENAQVIRSLKTGKPVEDPSLSSRHHTKDIQENGCGAWCSFEYDIRWHITDKETATIGERDRQVNGAINAIETFWEETEPDALLKMTKEDIIGKLKEIASQYSTPEISISVDEEHVFFESMDERHLAGEELPQ